MADVTFDLVPPDDPDLVALRIYEAASSDGPFSQIERTTAVGIYPYYIGSYTTSAALSADDWFYVAWENSVGDVGYESSPIKGGTFPLVDQVVERVLQRDPSLDEAIVRQEAEAAVQVVYGLVDPYSIAQAASYKQLNGLVYLTMACCYVFEQTTNNESVTIGLVSLKENTTSAKNIDALIDMANDALGISTSRVLQMVDVCKRHGVYEVTVP